MSATRPLVQARIKDNGLSYRFNWISPTFSLQLPVLFLFYSHPAFVSGQSGLITDDPSYFSQNNAVCIVQVRRQSDYCSFCACLEIDSNFGLFSLELSQECVLPHACWSFPNLRLLRCVAAKNVGVRQKGREGFTLWKKRMLGSFISSIVSNWLQICFVLGRF